MGVYDGAASTAFSLISAKGSDAVFTRVDERAFNPVTQVETTRSTTLRLKAVAVPPGRSAEFRVGSLERRNIVELHCAPRGGPTPRPGDKARWANADWTVIWSNDLDPAADGPPYCLVYLER